MPESWRPSGARQKTLSTAPWSAEESKDALHAINRGMAELTGFFAYRPAAIAVLRDDAVEAFIDLSYAAGNTQMLRSAAREQALRMLTPLMGPYLAPAPDQIACSESRQMLSYTNYARPAAAGRRAHAGHGGTHQCGLARVRLARRRDGLRLPGAHREPEDHEQRGVGS